MEQLYLKKKIEGFVNVTDFKPIVCIINKYMYPDIYDMDYNECKFIKHVKKEFNILFRRKTDADIDEFKKLLNTEKLIIGPESYTGLACEGYNINNVKIYIRSTNLYPNRYELKTESGFIYLINIKNIKDVEITNKYSRFSIIPHNKKDDDCNIYIDSCSIDYDFSLTPKGKVRKNNRVYKLFKEILTAYNISVTNED